MHEILLDNIIRSWADHGQHQVQRRFYCAGKALQLRIIQDYNHHDYTSVLRQQILRINCLNCYYHTISSNLILVVCMKFVLYMIEFDMQSKLLRSSLSLMCIRFIPWDMYLDTTWAITEYTYRILSTFIRSLLAQWVVCSNMFDRKMKKRL